MSTTPYYQIRIDHSRNADARAAAATMEKTLGGVEDARLSVWTQERDWWSSTSAIVNVAVSYTPFDDHDGSKLARTKAFADRLAELLGVEVRIHDNID